LGLKAEAARSGAGAYHVKNIVVVLKSFLRFCRLAYGMQTLDPRHLRYPRIPKREVLYLTPEEVEAFLAEVEQWNRAHAEDGFRLVTSGPWPPYHFVPRLDDEG